jgi:hypothetical protein
MAEKTPTSYLLARRVYEAWFCGCTPHLVEQETPGRFTHIADENEQSPLVQQAYQVLAMQRYAYDRDTAAQ